MSEAARPLASALASTDRSAWGLVTWRFDRPGTFLYLALPEVFAAVCQHGEALKRSGLSLCFRWIDPMARPDLLAATEHPNEFVLALAKAALDRLKARRRGG